MKKDYPLVSIIIPAYNEEKNIASVIKDVFKLGKKYPLEIIVVDDGSKDKTAEMAKKAGATKVISYQKNKGKGGAFRVGIDKASGEYIVQIDADHQFQPKEIPMFIEALHHGYDVVVGSRFNKGIVEKGSVSKTFIIGHWMISLATTFFSGIRVTDIMTGFKALKTEAARKLDLVTQHFGYEAEIIVKAGKLNLSALEIPITYTKRIHGSSSINAIEDGLKVSFTIMKMYFTFPGPPLGQGVVGKRLLNFFLPIWFVVLIPLITSFALSLPFNSIQAITQIFYSILLFIFILLITKSKLAATIGSLFFASSNIFEQAFSLPAEILLSSLLINHLPQLLSYIIAIFVALIFLVVISIQEKKFQFLKYSFFSLLIISLTSKLSGKTTPENYVSFFSLGLVVFSTLMASYFWKYEKAVSWSYILAGVMILISVFTPIPFASLIGISLFSGVLISSLFLELTSFRKNSAPMFSFSRIIPMFFLFIFAIGMLLLKTSKTV